MYGISSMIKTQIELSPACGISQDKYPCSALGLKKLSSKVCAGRFLTEPFVKTQKKDEPNEPEKNEKMNANIC